MKDEMPTSEIVNVTLKYGKSSINCLKVGEGQELLIAFHGYGDSALLFAKMVKRMPHRFVLYAVDLPIHGKSKWKGRRIEGELYAWIVQQILMLEKIDTCSLMGFSYGGRIVLHLIENIPQLIKHIYLIAPDGIVVSGLYRVVQKIPDFLKRFLFKLLISRHTVKLAKRLYTGGWLNHHNYRFAEINFATRKKRRRLLVYWLSIKDLDPDWNIVREKVVSYQIKMQLFLGTHDEVIPSRAGKMISEEVTNAEVVFLNANHRQLIRVFFQRAQFLLNFKDI